MGNVTSFNKDVRILDNLPAVLNEIDEIKAIANVEDPILSSEWELITSYVNNEFVLTADADGLNRYERMLKLQVSDLDTLDTRRMQILARYQEQAPYTWKVLHNILDSLLGAGSYILQRNVAEKYVIVKIELTVARQFAVVSELLERITPQNMDLVIELRYNTWGKIKVFNWGQMKNKTWGQVKEDII